MNRITPDASLASPALSAQPQGEREAFEAWKKRNRFGTPDEAWMARASLADASGIQRSRLNGDMSASTTPAAAPMSPDRVGVGVDESGGLILIFTRAGEVESTQRLRPGEQVLLSLAAAPQPADNKEQA